MTDMIAAAYPSADIAFEASFEASAAPGGALGSLILASLAAAAIGAGVIATGHGLLAAVLMAWIAAIVLTVAIPAVGLLLRRKPAPEADPADVEAWNEDLRKELKAERASSRVA